MKRSSKSLDEMSQALTANDEEKFFALLGEQQVRELQCAGDFAKSSLSEINQDFANSDLKKKLTMARLVRQKAQGLGKRIVSDPMLATPVCPGNFEALEMQFPKGMKRGANYQACKELISYRQSYQAIVSAIPLSGSPVLNKVIEQYAGGKSEIPDSELQKQLANAYGETQKLLEANQQSLAKNLKENGAEGLDREARHELLQDPALRETVVQANKGMTEVACRANARYGEGADNLNNSVMVGSLILGGGSAVVGKVGAFTARAFETSKLARATGMVSLNGMNIIRYAVMGTDFASMAALTKQACFSEKLSDLKAGNACVSAPSAAKVEKDNCLLVASLTAMGIVPQAMIAELSKNIKSTLAAEKRAQALEKVVAEAPPVAKVVKPTPVVPKLSAQAVEKQLAEGTIVSQKEVGRGAFGARYVKYSDGSEGVWKATMSKGGLDTASSEVAAYKVDSYLGLKSVPVTVKKEVDGQMGSVQYRVKALKETDEDIAYLRDPEQTGFLDYLIANNDRHGGNFLQKEDGKLIAIDHGLSFSSSMPRAKESFVTFQGKIGALDKNLKSQQRIQEKIAANPKNSEILKMELADLKKDASELQSAINAFAPSKAVVDKLRVTSREDWKRVVGDNLTEWQIDALIKRQETLVHAFEVAEKRIGAERLYPAGPASPLLKTDNFGF
ncbi:MAG: hypothetical protein J7501_02825 [Bdellovibrio sp.]|nr:hypothetical protein [Bdellovibrio sp.]